jgi:hypothetical protein
MEYVTPEMLARWFHQEYERIAPEFNYKTREASAVPWEQVPENNRRLMMAVAASVLLRFFSDRMAVYHDETEK